MTVDLDPKSAGFDPARLARIDEHLHRNYVDPGRIAGCQVLVARHGHVAHRSSLGLMDRERSTPVADDAIWRLYSMTKPITGVALLGLYEQAKCKLTDPIARYLPEWRDTGVRVKKADGTKDVVAADNPITIRDALMHMTGIGFGPPQARLDLEKLAEGGPARRLAPGTTLADLSVMLAEEPLHFQPGTHWLYSWSTDICARLVEVISGETFGDHLRRTIFDPLGMVDTGFSVRDEGDAARVAALYARAADKTLRLVDDPARGTLLREPSLQSGGGGLVGTLDDYARFCQMLLGGGELDGRRVLARPTVELMRTNHLPGDGELREFALPGGYGEVGFDGSGFGLTVAVGLGPRRSASAGPAGSFMWGGAASTIFWIDPVEDLYVVFMTQLLPSGTFDFRGQLRALTYGAIND
jgi:CubicO group peptidase (beta-lactamase class C family)